MGTEVFDALEGAAIAQNAVAITIFFCVLYCLFRHFCLENTKGVRIVNKALCVFFLLTVAVSFGFTANATNVVQTSLKEEYNVNSNYGQVFDLYYGNIVSGVPSVPLACTIEGDRRYYDVFLIKEVGTDAVGAFTRNEKGVYLPITKASREELKNSNTNGSNDTNTQDQENIESQENNQDQSQNHE